MSNLITATIYQIDGSPLLQSATVDFQVSDILIKEASINIPQVQSVIFVYNVPNNQLGGKAYYAGEDVATLVASANDALVALTQATILEINGDPQPPGGIQCAFPSQEIIISEDIRPSGVNSAIQYKGTTYYASETQATLVANSNNLSGIVLNQLDVPAFRADTLANLPAPGQQGLMFISTDTYAFYRDNGASWDLIGGPGVGTVTGSGAATQVAFWNGASVVSGSSNLFWDSTNNRLGIGTSSPANALDVTGSARITGNLTTNLTTGSIPFIGASGLLTQNNSQLFWDSANNRLGIGTSSPAYSIDITGTIRNTGETYLATNSNNVGINTTTISNPLGSDYTVLHIRGKNANGTGAIFLNNSDNTLRSALLQNNSYLGLTSISAHPLVLFTSNVERLRIHTTGNVSIGNAVDNGQRLNVTGGCDISGTLNAGGLATGTIQCSFIYNNTMEANTGNMSIRTNIGSGRTISFGDAATNLGANEYMRFFPSNTIPGIGTGAVDLITVKPTINQTTGTGTIYGYRFNPTNTAVLSTVYAFYADSGLSYFGGSVGISTTTPTAGFTLDNNGAFRNFGQAAFLMNTGDAGGGNGAVGLGVLPASVSRISGERVLEIGSYYATIRLRDGQNHQAEFTLGTPRVPQIGTTTASPFSIKTNNNTDRIYIHSNGNVGVGTVTDAGYKLQVTGTTFTTANTFLANSSGGVYIGSTNTSEANRLLVQTNLSSGSTVITKFQNGNASQVLTWDSGGMLLNTGNTYLATGGGAGVDTRSVGINTTTVNASAILQADSTTRGFLPPRMTNAQMTAIASPATGLMVYDTTNNKVNVYNGTAWEALH